MILIVDNGGANLSSVRFALERVGVAARVSADPEEILAADRVLLPGVGAAGPAMARMDARGVTEALRARDKPVLGICLGMQLLFRSSGEGDIACLDILPDRVSRFAGDGLRVPHMGWNRVRWSRTHPLTAGLDDGNWFYFVHSYRAPMGTYTLGECDYGGAFSAAVVQDNFAGFQFHPERSGDAGASLLAAFAGWSP